MLLKYYYKVIYLMVDFEKDTIEHIKREHNTRADLLSKLASTKSKRPTLLHYSANIVRPQHWWAKWMPKSVWRWILDDLDQKIHLKWRMQWQQQEIDKEEMCLFRTHKRGIVQTKLLLTPPEMHLHRTSQIHPWRVCVWFQYTKILKVESSVYCMLMDFWH